MASWPPAVPKGPKYERLRATRITARPPVKPRTPRTEVRTLAREASTRSAAAAWSRAACASEPRRPARSWASPDAAMPKAVTTRSAVGSLSSWAAAGRASASRSPSRSRERSATRAGRIGCGASTAVLRTASSRPRAADRVSRSISAHVATASEMTACRVLSARPATTAGPTTTAAAAPSAATGQPVRMAVATPKAPANATRRVGKAVLRRLGVHGHPPRTPRTMIHRPAPIIAPAPSVRALVTAAPPGASAGRSR